MATKDGRNVIAQLNNYVVWEDMTGIQKCITIAGSQKAVADQIGVSQQAVSEWEKRGFVPANRVVELESEYGVERAELIDPALRALLTRE